jgi:hypothetical protein
MGQTKLQIQQKENSHHTNSAIKAAEVEKRNERTRQNQPFFSFTDSISSLKIAPNPHNILNLQKAIGNQAVGQFIQTKLKIGQPGDKYEQEADRVADTVMGMPISSVRRQTEDEDETQRKPIADQITPLVQRQEDDEEDIQGKNVVQNQEAEEEKEEPPIQMLQRQEEEEESLQTQPIADQITSLVQRRSEQEEEEEIQAKASNVELIRSQETEPKEEEDESVQTKQVGGKSPVYGTKLETQMNSIKSGGQPLSESVRKFFEPRFGYDFSQIRVHTNAQATELSRSLNARAFTAGRNVVFGSGQLVPETIQGRRLLAHELTHVIQQGGGGRIGNYTTPIKQTKKIQLKAKRFKPRIHKGGISYRKLIKDKKLEIGVAIGYPFLGEYKRLITYLKKQKFNRMGPQLIKLFKISGWLIPIVQTFLKKGVEKWQRVKRFWLRRRKSRKKKPIDVEISIDVINHKSKDPKKHFADFLSSKEIAIYSGHARYGTGPDFDSKKSARENFIIGINSALHKTGRLTKGYKPKINKALKGRANELEAMSKAGRFDPKLYQIWLFNACKTIHYLDEIRGGLVKGKTRTNLRVIGTTRGIYIDAIPFIDGILKQQSMRRILRRLNKAESSYRKRKGEKTRRSYYFSD